MQSLLDLLLVLPRGYGAIGVEQLVKQGSDLVADTTYHVLQLPGNGTVLGGRCDGNTTHLNGLLRRHSRDGVAQSIHPHTLACHIPDICGEGDLETIHTIS